MLILLQSFEHLPDGWHIERLKAALVVRGERVEALREPGATPLGEAIREILLSHKYAPICPRAELYLYEAARAQIVDERITPALAAGKIVLCDRFFDSTTAYQGYGRGLDIAMVETLNHTATGGLVPDCTFIFDVPIQDGLKRATRKGTPDRLESEDHSFHEAVREGFARIAQQEPDRVHLIDSTRSKEEVSEEIRTIALEVIDRVQ